MTNPEGHPLREEAIDRSKANAEASLKENFERGDVVKGFKEGEGLQVKARLDAAKKDFKQRTLLMAKDLGDEAALKLADKVLSQLDSGLNNLSVDQQIEAIESLDVYAHGQLDMEKQTASGALRLLSDDFDLKLKGNADLEARTWDALMTLDLGHITYELGNNSGDMHANISTQFGDTAGLFFNGQLSLQEDQQGVQLNAGGQRFSLGASALHNEAGLKGGVTFNVPSGNLNYMRAADGTSTLQGVFNNKGRLLKATATFDKAGQFQGVNADMTLKF